MSPPLGRLVLTLNDLTNNFRETFERFIDPRRGNNTLYTRVDAALSAFSVFFMQSPSFLEDPRSLEHMHGNNHAQTLFGVHKIPSDHHLRTLLNATDPDAVRPEWH